MPDVIDLCSDGEEDLPVQNFAPKKNIHKPTHHVPPKPTNAKGAVRFPPNKGSHPSVANGPMSQVPNNSRIQNGAAASNSSRSPKKALPNGTTSTQSSKQRLGSFSSSAASSNRDRPLAGSASQASQGSRSVALKPGFRDRSHLSSSQEGLGASSSSGSLQERGQKRAHNGDTPRSNGSNPLGSAKQVRHSGLGGNTPSSRTLNGRPLQSPKATIKEAPGVINLISDDDEPQAKKSRNNSSSTGIPDPPSSSGGPLRALELSKRPNYRSTPLAATPSSSTPNPFPAGRPALDASQRPPQLKASEGLSEPSSRTPKPSPAFLNSTRPAHNPPHPKANKGLSATNPISSDLRTVHTSIESSLGTKGQTSAVPGTSSFKNTATSSSSAQKSGLGSTPVKSRESSQKSFIRKTSIRSSEVRERRSTIPESPPLLPLPDVEVHKPLSGTSPPGTSSREKSSSPKTTVQPIGVSNQVGLKRKIENIPQPTLSDKYSVPRSDRPYGPEGDAGKSKNHIVSPESNSRSPGKDRGEASVTSTAATETKAAEASSISHCLEGHHDLEALLQADAQAQHTQVANAAPKLSSQPHRARSQDQLVERLFDAPLATTTSSDVRKDGRSLASGEQPSRPKFTLSLRKPPQRNDSTRVNTPQLASSREVSLVRAQTTGFNAIERAVGQYVEEMQSDNEHWTRVELQRARVRRQTRATVNNPGAVTSVFASMAPIPLRLLHKKSVPTGCAKLTTELHPLTSKPQRNSYFARYTTYDTSDTVEVPKYNHYVSISNNLLANNVTSLQHWPYFGDDFDLNEASNLKKEYYVDVDDRERKLLRLGQAESFAPYAEDLMKSVDCEWPDVLHFLLELEPDVGTSSDARKALQERERFIAEDFIRDGERWGKVLGKLSTPSPDKAGRAAVLCDHFQRLAKFSFWHLVRRSAYTKRLVADAEEVPDESQLTCRVCMRFNCPYHGEIRDHPRGQGPADNQIVETDIILPQVVNYRSRVPFPTSVDAEPVNPDRRRTLDYWERGPFGNLKWKADERDPFYPCHHPGLSCSDARCSCYDARIACEKSCSCGPGCKRKWKGCSCHSGKRPKGKTVCWEDERCACWQLSRECDPDLCGDCGVADVLDPIHRHDDRILQNRCRLASLQRGVAKHTIIGDSGVHGLGLYACEDIRPDDFVGEYKGETITKEEAERRGAVYEHQKLSYLFTLNQKQEVDSTYFGNKIRFINHVQESKANLRPAIQMVNTVFRIGMYAKKKIRAGEEFFFDYGPSFPRDQLDGNKQSKSAPRARVNPQNFHEVDLVRDQEGHVRARKKAAGTGSGSSEDGDDETPRRPGRPQGSPNKHRRRALTETSSSESKEHGGARLGAGRPRRTLQPVDEVEGGTNKMYEVQHSKDDAVASNGENMDPEHRLNLYNVQDGSAEDEDFELEEESLSELDVMSSAEE